jgi:hypothetical protein
MNRILFDLAVQRRAADIALANPYLNPRPVDTRTIVDAAPQ